MPLGFEYSCFSLWVLMVMALHCTPVHSVAGQSTELVFVEVCLRLLPLEGWGLSPGSACRAGAVPMGITVSCWALGVPAGEAGEGLPPAILRQGVAGGQQEERGTELISSHQQSRCSEGIVLPGFFCHGSR